jgi:hypothetical protein
MAVNATKNASKTLALEYYIDLDGVMLNDIEPRLRKIGFTEFESSAGERLAPLLRTAGEGFVYASRKMAPLFALFRKNLLEDYTFTPEVIEAVRKAPERAKEFEDRTGIKVDIRFYGVTSNKLRDIEKVSSELKGIGADIQILSPFKHASDKWDYVKSREARAVLINDDTDAFKNFRKEEDKYGVILHYNHFAVEDFIALKLKKGLEECTLDGLEDKLFSYLG